MAVAAYASLVSLTEVLDNIQHPARCHLLHLDKEQMQNLQQKVQFLSDFLELHSQRISPEIEDLARQLVVVADGAEDIIDFSKSSQLSGWEALNSCPYPELEEIGRKTAKGCRGLPLSIVVIGGLLAKSNNTREYWEFVAQNVTSFVNTGDDDYCLKILSLSYNSLPIHLKPCFLYMRVFREDDWIEASELMKLWIGEGFQKPVGGKSLKEAAKEYLKDLADRNLILIRKWTLTRKIKTCSVHDILRELCFREFEREHVIRVPKTQKTPYSVEHDVCFLCSHKLIRHNKIHIQEVVGLQSTTVASPSICEACSNMYQNLNKLRWVEVFKSVHDKSDVTSLLHTRLRYLKVEGYDMTEKNWKLIVPGTISLLWNLQILDLGYLVTTSLSEIWEMPKLRHLSIDGRFPHLREGQDPTILENLSTLRIGDFCCSEAVVKRIPNLKKLTVYDCLLFSADFSCAAE
ncbi:UNVERIFIED_CONTAM: putative late blight resistance proteinR1B-16 [Sesamum radiatum]|uniref:Late blight resistance proteinR1B-16 n=1 Tax=Sesamum radiatum TaxID=300843 RepID=A0AAW2PL40_SESRA